MNREEALSIIENLTADEFHQKIDHLRLSMERTTQFHDVITGKILIDGYNRFDIQEFALKTIFRDEYKEFRTLTHPNSVCELYEFDPAKNGQNLVKHGLGFIEVASYSRRFGTLNIPCPDLTDDERIVSFSDLDLEGKYKLTFPSPKFKNQKCCFSILKQTNNRFRFISSRLLSSEKSEYTKEINQSIRSVKFADMKSKISFVDRAVELLERDLIGKT